MDGAGTRGRKEEGREDDDPCTKRVRLLPTAPVWCALFRTGAGRT